MKRRRAREASAIRALAKREPAGLAMHVIDKDLAIFEWDIGVTAEVSLLTAAEREVLQAIVSGDSNAAIATSRGVSARTIANQVSAILRKLGASSRYELRRRIGAP
ncbi:MAG TPA: helix-turn-helix transcriptional regulator [Kofleriaceae bacterium]